jgi:hypothetical protein
MRLQTFTGSSKIAKRWQAANRIKPVKRVAGSKIKDHACPPEDILSVLRRLSLVVMGPMAIDDYLRNEQ